MVIDHDQLRLLGPALQPCQPALLVLRARGAAAGVRARVDVPPQSQLVGQVGDLGPVARSRSAPLHSTMRGTQETSARSSSSGSRSNCGQTITAEVVVPPLHHAGRELHPDPLAQKGQVLVVDLVLQVARAGGDDDPAAGLQRGHEVGQGLAGAGAGLDHQRAAVARAGRGDGPRHLLLARPVLVAGVGPGQRSAGPEEVARGDPPSGRAAGQFPAASRRRGIEREAGGQVGHLGPDPAPVRSSSSRASRARRSGRRPRPSRRGPCPAW